MLQIFQQLCHLLAGHPAGLEQLDCLLDRIMHRIRGFLNASWRSTLTRELSSAVLTRSKYSANAQAITQAVSTSSAAISAGQAAPASALVFRTARLGLARTAPPRQTLSRFLFDENFTQQVAKQMNGF